jgi:hypothetical protein
MKILVKKTNQKDLVKMFESKSICPKWHFGQVGHGGKKSPRGGFFNRNFWSKTQGFLVLRVCIVLSFFFLLTKAICS